MNEGIARDVLEKERARLVMARSALTKRLIEDQSRLTPLDRAESAPDLDQLEVALAVRGIIDDDLRAIDDALDRVNAGTYGACAACGSPSDSPPYLPRRSASTTRASPSSTSSSNRACSMVH